MNNKIALTNLGKYNEGILIYTWLNLPFSDEELQDALDKIGINEEYEEYFISDYETDINYKIGEYENLNSLNEIFEQIEQNSDDEDFTHIINAYLDNMYNDINQAIEEYNNGNFRIYYECNSMDDVAYTIIEELGTLDSMPDNLQCYFNYEALGRDLAIEGSYFYISEMDAYVEFF